MNLKKMIKREIVITIISVMAITITFFGLSYAIYMTIDEKELAFQTDTLSFNMCIDTTCENISNDLGNVIDIEMYPMSQEEGLDTSPYSFVITNNGDLDIDTTIYIYTKETNVDINNINIGFKESQSLDYSIVSFDNGNTKILAQRVNLSPDESKTYNILIWANEQISNNIIGNTFSSYINVVGYYYPEGSDELSVVYPTSLESGILSMNFTESGDYIIPISGKYKVELWGASGGTSSSLAPGNGAYTSGVIYLDAGESLGVNIGGQGSSATGIGGSPTLGGFNGGGNTYSDAGAGGGSTDIRYDGETLNDRIMVAAGGGGSGTMDPGCLGGNSGGLVGYPGGSYGSSGATQTGNIFGVGGNGTQIYGSSGGSGSGYYGGYSDATGGGGGGGGSSFISGHAGSLAVLSSSSTSLKNGCTSSSTTINCSVHYSNKYFEETKMIDGAGNSWTTIVGEREQMPNPNGGYYIYGQGHTGDGYARITYIPELYLPTPIEDFEYAIDTWVYPPDGTEVPVDEGYVLLTEYIGTDTTVNIPSTYQINGETYNTLIFNERYNFRIGTFRPYDEIEENVIPNTTIEYINLSKDLASAYYDGVWWYQEMSHIFWGMTALKRVNTIPNSVTHMDGTFAGCTSLTEAPVIPSSVTDMNSTFLGCTSLVEAPVIPSSVTDMNSTFLGCTSLVEAPVIPSSVTYMGGTFSGCTSLVEAPAIPNSVTYMGGTFYNCTNLEGEVLINSSGLTNISSVFHGTTKSITAKVPAGSTTFTTISGVTLPRNVTVETF